MASFRWPGLVKIGQRLLYGSPSAPKAKHVEGISITTSEAYESMHKYYRWFRQDELVRSCIVTNAFFACMSAGFETVLEPADPSLSEEEKERLLEQYAYVKHEIDDLNKRVNMDRTLFIAQIKRSIYGKAGFEIVVDEDLVPERLLPLRSDQLKPKLNDSWELVSFNYEGKHDFYQPQEVLYFVNLGLEADLEGLSDIEPIIDICKARHQILRRDIPEISMTLWAPFLFIQADTSGLSAEEADRALDALNRAIKPGKRIIVNESVQGQVVDMKPDIPGLKELLDKLDLMIIGNFRTPRFLVGKPVENRATAFAELEAYVQGPIANIQRYFKRELERQWYDPQVRRILEREEKLRKDEPLPVVIKHRWNLIRTVDIYELYRAVSQLYAQGMGVIDRKKAYELLGFDPSELEEVGP